MANYFGVSIHADKKSSQLKREIGILQKIKESYVRGRILTEEDIQRIVDFYNSDEYRVDNFPEKTWKVLSKGIKEWKSRNDYFCLTWTNFTQNIKNNLLSSDIKRFDFLFSRQKDQQILWLLVPAGLILLAFACIIQTSSSCYQLFIKRRAPLLHG